MLVDFAVSDKSGRPVTGLSAKDFVVKEDGRERAIVSFTAFAADEPAGLPAPDIERAASSPAGRSASAATVLLVDDGQLTLQQAMRVRPALKALLMRLGERNAALALVAPWSKVSEAGLLSQGTANLTTAVDRIVGQRSEDYSTFPVSDPEAVAVVRGDARALARLSNRFLALNPDLSATQAEGFARGRAAAVAFDARTRRELVYGVALLALDWLADQRADTASSSCRAASPAIQTIRSTTTS